MSDLESRKANAATAIDKAAPGLRELSLAIHGQPELNFQEHKAHAALSDYLERAGLDVSRGAYGMETAFKAVAGSGSPTVAVFCEYDALPGIGHACGHNLIAASGVAVGLALKAALAPGEGTVLVLGSPAEEGGGGKIVIIEQGALLGVDAAMMLHPTPQDAAWANVIAIEQLAVVYHGRNAHASAFPWEGINALDAMVTAYNAISVLRQQIRPNERVHGVITEGGLKPNIIPDRTAAEYYIRAPSRQALAALRARVAACFEGAATATSCSLDLKTDGRPYDDLVNNDALAAAYCDNMQTLGLSLPTKDQSLRGPAASTDMGNVSYVLPSIHPMFGIPVEPGVGNHTPGFTGAAATEEAHASMLRASKALAMTALDVYLQPGLLDSASKEFANLSRRA